MPIFRITRSIPLQTNADLIGELADIGTELAKRDLLTVHEAAELTAVAETLLKLSVIHALHAIAADDMQRNPDKSIGEWIAETDPDHAP